MKAVTFTEFDSLVEEARRYLGVKAQSILFDNDILMIGFGGTSSATLVIDVRSRIPFFIMTERQLPRLKKQTKPIVLFLKAHLLGLKLISVERISEYGRLIEFVFAAGEKTLRLEAHLAPQGKNIKVFTEESTICLKKPMELLKITDSKVFPDKRSVEQLYTEWMSALNGGSDKSEPLVGQHESKQGQMVEKKRQGLLKLLENKDVLSGDVWAEFADWLNVERTDVVPNKYAKMYDHDLSVVQNIDNAFAQSKKIRSKKNQLDERIGKLQQELELLESGKVSVPVSRAEPANPILGAKGRTREFSQGIKAYIGKSGTDNLKILRQSKPWYLWVHAKDWPSAHAIIAINKNQNVPQSILREVCLWVLKETITSKQWSSWLGVKVDFLYTERRFVQTIKGDHHGQVRYSQVNTMTVEVEDF